MVPFRLTLRFAKVSPEGNQEFMWLELRSLSQRYKFGHRILETSPSRDLQQSAACRELLQQNLTLPSKSPPELPESIPSEAACRN